MKKVGMGLEFVKQLVYIAPSKCGTKFSPKQNAIYKAGSRQFEA